MALNSLVHNLAMRNTTPTAPAATAAAPATMAAWRNQNLTAVLFDLDGTLLDTADDIALALNRATDEYGWPALTLNQVRNSIGRGAPLLVERAATLQGRNLDAVTHSAITERFFHHYEALEESGEGAAKPYPGAAEVLQKLHGIGLRIAVVTNKQQRFATALVKLKGLSAWIDQVVGGDSCARRKPDPLPLVFACRLLGVQTRESIMVGDSVNDVQAARAAGIPIICVPHGYNEGQDPRTLQCDALIEQLTELPRLLSVA